MPQLKKICRALVLLAVSLTLLNAVIFWRAKRVAYVPPSRALDLPIDAIDGVVIFAGDDTVAKFAKIDRQWQFRAPQAGVLIGTADRETMEAILSFAARAERTTAKISAAAAGLDDIGNLPQIVFYVGEKSRSVYLGNFSADGEERYFLLDRDIDTPLVVPAALTRIFDRPPAQFRSRDLFAFTARGPDAIITAGTPSPLEIRKTLDGWNLIRPFQWPADDQQINALLQLCLSLRARDFADQPPRENPLATLTLKTGGHEQTVNFYRDDDRASDETAVLATRSDRPEIYRVDNALAVALQDPQLSEFLRRKNLDLLNGREIAAIYLTAADGQTLRLSRENDNWQAAGDQTFPADTTAVKNLLALAAQLPLLKILPENAAKRQFTRETAARAQFYDSGGAMVAEIRMLTAVDPDSSAPRFYAQVSGRPQVLDLHPLAGITLTQPFLAYRSRALTNFPANEITQIRIDRPIDNGAYNVYRQIGAARYQQAAPVEKNLSEEFNWELLAIARMLAQFHCAGYIAQISEGAAEYGLDRPKLKITLTCQNANPPRELTLIVGDELTLDDSNLRLYAAAFADNPYIFAIDEKQVLRFLRVK